MKSSRTTSLIDVSDKTFYPKCNLKKEHQKESLNMICITKTCKYHGPICGLCKKEHSGHNVVTIKNFLSSIELIQKNSTLSSNKIQEKLEIEQNIKKSPLQRLQESYRQIMGMLNLQVQQLSQQIRKTQDNLIKQFQQTQKALNEQGMKEQILTDSMNFLQNKRFEDGLEFRKNINTILKLVSINKNQFTMKTKEEDILKNYERKIQTCKENLIFTSLQIKQLYSSLQDQLMRQKAQKVTDIIRPKTAIVSTIKPQNIVFSRILKASNILVEKDGKCARLKDNHGNKIIFLHNVISSKIFQTTIKVVNQSEIMTIGAALKDRIKLKDYKFQKNPGHGLYGISSNCFKFNHTQKNQDGTQTGFNFSKGDQITISLKVQEKKLIFSSKDSKKKAEINLKSLPDNSFKQLQFCVLFSSMGDKVQIL